MVASGSSYHCPALDGGPAHQHTHTPLRFTDLPSIATLPEPDPIKYEEEEDELDELDDDDEDGMDVEREVVRDEVRLASGDASSRW